MLSPNSRLEPPVAFRLVRVFIMATSLCGLVAACSSSPIDSSRDVGNMAFPQPLPQGNLSTTTVAGRLPRDTGNMAYPDQDPAGVVARVTVTRRTLDTGNMAYPTPLPQATSP